MAVTLPQLQVFVALCDTLHFTRAAQRLSSSQPTVSKEIRALERALGFRLLDRSSGGTTLTREGMLLEAKARAAVDGVQSFEVTAAEVRRQFRQEVTIAASPSIVNRLLPETLRQVDSRSLGVTLLTPLEVETGDVVAAVESGLADIGVGHHLQQPVRSTKRRLGDDELHAVISSSLVPADSRAVDLRQLGSVPLLLWARDRSPDYYDAMVEACRDRGLDPLLLTATSRISGSWSFLLEDARAFTLAPKDFAHREARGGLVSLTLLPPFYVPLEVVWRRSSAEVDAVIEILWDLTEDRRPGEATTRDGCSS